MSVFARDFTDISVENNSLTVQINNTESNFAVAPGSRLFLIGFLPVAVASSDSTARTLTLEKPWANATQTNVAASVIPIGLGDWLLTALESNRAAYQAFVETIENQEDPLTEVRWETIVAETLPAFVKRWASFEEITDKPEHVLGYPSFDKVTGKVSKDQLPNDIDADNQRTVALSPPVKTEPSFTQRLVEYPKLKQTEDIPTTSPNNRKEILTDNIRGLVHVAMPDSWFTVPNSLQSRKFMVMPSDRYLRLNSLYTGDITLRVCPMGNGGTGLPNNPTLADHQWHTITESVTNLATIGDGFVGVIDFIQMGNRWETLDTDKSHFEALNAYYTRDNDASVSSPFLNFSLRSDGYWYSDDMTPSTPYTIGGSWVQDGNTFTATEATGSTDALRFFADSFDNYVFEIVLVVNYIAGNMAITNENRAPNIVYYPGTGRYITDDRIYFKRAGTSVTAAFTVESTRMRMPHYG